jgi:hypothetical protein
MLSFTTADMMGCDGCNGCATKGQSQAPISLFHNNQTLSAGVAPNKNNKNVLIFHEYITSAAQFDIINY